MSERVCRLGLWNDPDMPEIGNRGMTDDEYRSQCSSSLLVGAQILLCLD